MVESKIRSTSWTFTIFDDFKDDFWDKYKDIIRGLAFGEEICPKTKKKHLQGFIQMYSQCRMSKLIGIFKESKFKAPHFEKMKGSIKDNKKYCSKESELKKYGSFVSRGHRSDLHSIKDDLKKGVNLYNIMDNYTSDFVRYNSGIDKMKSLIDKNRRKKMGFVCPEVIVLYGKPGEGKTSYVYDKEGFDDVFCISRYNDDKFMFNGYDNEKVLLLDDFNGNISYNYMLRLMDGYPLDLNVKNGVRYNFFEKIYITSNNVPGSWYRNHGIKDNFKRRISSCLEVTKGNTVNLSHDEMWRNNDNNYLV